MRMMNGKELVRSIQVIFSSSCYGPDTNTHANKTKNNKVQAFNGQAPIVRIWPELFCCSHRDPRLLMLFAPYGSDLSIIRVSRADRLCNRFVNPLKPTRFLSVSSTRLEFSSVATTRLATTRLASSRRKWHSDCAFAPSFCFMLCADQATTPLASVGP